METQTRHFTIDPAHTSVGFSIRHLMIAKVRGSFHSVRGAIELSSAGYIPTSVTAEIDVASIDTHQAQRDGHLKSSDFFEAETYPTIRFVSTRIDALDDTRFRLVGNLEMHGAKRSVTLDAEFTGQGTDLTGGQRIAYEATTRIKRSDFDLTWNAALEAGGVAVGDDVEITLDIEALA